MRDHFHPPLSERRLWESFFTTWSAALADLLNRDLPRGQVALEFASLAATGDEDRFGVEVSLSASGELRFIGAIELVSPGNKDRPSKRRLFAAKCATYLARGVGLIIVDVVSSVQANMHNELVGLLGLDARFQMPADTGLYAAAYRPVTRDGSENIEIWPMALAVGEPLPALPLSLAADFCVSVDFEAAYQDACERRRIAEAIE